MIRSTRPAVTVAAVTAVAVFCGADPAMAAWHMPGAAATGYTRASALASGSVPTASATGSTVNVSWAASAVAPGVFAAGYVVTRTDAATGAVQTTGAGCAGTVTATACAETGVPDGSWRYAVRPVQGSNWTGARSASSAAVTVSTVAAATAVTFPATGQTYNAAGYNAGCGTPGGDLCGTANAAGGSSLTGVRVSVRQGTGNYWNPATSGFTSATEQLFAVTSGTTSWSVAFPVTNFAVNGQYTLRAVSTDNLSRTTSASSTFTVLGSAPPAPTITAQPANPTKLQTASFSFTDTQAGVTFQCALDSGTPATCTSPKNYSGLTEGQHTFSVAARDAFGATGPATTFTWKVDLTAPTLVDVQAVNGSRTAGLIDAGDVLTFTFGEPMDPASVRSGWAGDTTAVTMHLAHSSNHEDVSITGTNLGTVTLGNGYANGDFDVAATMVMTGSQVVVTIQASNAQARGGGKADLVWTPTTLLTDLAGNPVAGTAATETGTKDVDF